VGFSRDRDRPRGDNEEEEEADIYIMGIHIHLQNSKTLSSFYSIEAGVQSRAKRRLQGWLIKHKACKMAWSPPKPMTAKSANPKMYRSEI
jgi:hypothetical protein